MQSRLLKEALESKLHLALEITPFSDLWLEENKPETHNIQKLMIDYSRISDDVLTDYSSFKHISCPDAKEVIINCPQDIEHKLLFKWNNLAEVFYIDDDMDTMIKGMSKILQDEMWLTRKLAQEYILHYRAGNSVVTSQMYAKLTKENNRLSSCLVVVLLILKLQINSLRVKIQ